MNKSDLRKHLLGTRINSSEKDRDISKRLISNVHFISAETVLTYVSVREEIDTINIITYCFSSGKTVAVPKVVNNELVFKIIHNLSDLKPGFFNIPEPDDCCKTLNSYKNSICIVPALACDTDNNRLGYGKGFYDRFLSRYNGYSVTLCYRNNIIRIPVDEHDVKTNCVLSET